MAKRIRNVKAFVTAFMHTESGKKSLDKGRVMALAFQRAVQE